MSNVSSTGGGMNYYKKRVDELESQVHDQLQRDREKTDRQSAELQRGYESAMDRQARASRQDDERRSRNTAKVTQRERDEARARVEEARRRLYDRLGKVNQDQAFNDEVVKKDLKDLKNEYELHRRKLDETTAAAEEARDHELQRHARDEAETLSRSHARETQDLHEQMRTLNKAAGQYIRDKSRATADVRRDFDSERNFREKMLRRRYRDEIDSLKRQAGRSEDAMAASKAAALDEQADHYTGLIAGSDRANAERLGEVQKVFQNTLQQERAADHKRQEQVTAALDRQLTSQRGAYDAAFERQQEAARQDLERHASIDRQEIERLRDDVHQRKTSVDYSYLNPALEAKIRRGYAEDYQKKLDADIRRSDERTQSLQQTYQSRLAELNDRQQARTTRLNRDFHSRSAEDRSEYMGQMREMEQNNRIERQNGEAETSHQIESIRKTYTQLLESQKQDYDQLLADLHSDAVDKLTAARRDSDQALKMAHQEMTSRTSAIIREYEKKTQDEKAAYETQIQNLKNQMTRAKNESERRTHQLLDQQARVYEQKIAQMEFQSKERERMISENYQDQMDKMKRAHALQQQAKS